MANFDFWLGILLNFNKKKDNNDSIKVTKSLNPEFIFHVEICVECLCVEF